MAGAFSIRESLQGALLDYIRSTGFECVHTEGLIRDLVCLLASYREEDVPLFPVLYVANSLPVLASVAPGVQRFILGYSGFGENAAKNILKDCAGLASSGWSVYVARTNGGVEYGLFRSLRHSYATSAEEAAKDLGKNSPMIILRNLGYLTVEMTNSQGDTYTVSFTSAPAAGSRLAEHISCFCEAIVAKLDQEEKVRFLPYAKRVLTESLQHCHGTLLAAVEAPTPGTKTVTLEEGVWLSEPLDWHMKHSQAHSSKDADSLSDLQATEALIEGMLNSDGVVVFGTNGTILAYRVLLTSTNDEKVNLPDSGGGRRRTYELMKSRIGTRLKGALFRSQDGATDCMRDMA